ncbi:CBL-interacting serine/threonine-protein kinase 12 [Forsythia ovata]|uniref:CBL-interacting serine/threonine-protein kinase 12 n=1 Tax=Forsythia ovata TaxID=205694 RepID=A0ABD1S2E0_9LAMI
MESLSDQSLSESESELDARMRFTSLPRPAKGTDGARFVSGTHVSNIISKLEEKSKVVSFSVRKKDCRMSLEGSMEGVKGPLTIAAEIFELTPSLRVVEVKKK